MGDQTPDSPKKSMPYTRPFHERVWYYTIDPELRIIHARRDCPDAKMAVKYKYATEFALREPRHGEQLDWMIEHDRYKICHRCYRTEQQNSHREKRPVMPGFKVPPPGYREPERRTPVKRHARKDVTRD